MSESNSQGLNYSIIANAIHTSFANRGHSRNPIKDLVAEKLLLPENQTSWESLQAIQDELTKLVFYKPCGRPITQRCDAMKYLAANHDNNGDNNCDARCNAKCKRHHSDLRCNKQSYDLHFYFAQVRKEFPVEACRFMASRCFDAILILFLLFEDEEIQYILKGVRNWKDLLTLVKLFRLRPDVENVNLVSQILQHVTSCWGSEFMTDAMTVMYEDPKVYHEYCGKYMKDVLNEKRKDASLAAIEEFHKLGFHLEFEHCFRL